MPVDTITKTVFFTASRETVWSFLTDKDKLGEWFHRAKRDLAQGEDYTLLRKTDDGGETAVCWGTVLQMDRPSKLVWSFTLNVLNGEMTTVSWTLEETCGGTRLTLEHSGIGAALGDGALDLLTKLDAGWDQHFGHLRTAVA